MRNSLLLAILINFTNAYCASKEVYKISERSRAEAVLTDSYGILSEDDVGIYAWMWEYTDNKKSSGIEYWTCHPTSSITKLNCDDFGYDPINREHNAEFEFDFKVDGKIYSVGGRRAFNIRYCRKLVNDIKALTKGQTHFCAGLGYIHEELGKGGTKIVDWYYDKFKTKKGCISYFDRCCEAGYWKQFGYPVAPYGSAEYPHP